VDKLMREQTHFWATREDEAVSIEIDIIANGKRFSL
jgi:hypothetical protein